MANTVASRKQKGKRLQNEVVQTILTLYPSLTARDVVSVPSSVPGPDIMLSEEASRLFPYSVECKNQESLQIWAAIKQSEDNASGLTPLLIFRRNGTPAYACLKLEDFINILRRFDELEHM